MREAAIEYRSLKLLETEIYSYKDDTNIPCGIALKKMAGLLDKYVHFSSILLSSIAEEGAIISFCLHLTV